MSIERIILYHNRPAWITWRNGDMQCTERIDLDRADTETVNRIWQAIQGRFWDIEEYWIDDGETASDLYPVADEYGFSDKDMRRMLFHRGVIEGQIFVTDGVMYQPMIEQFAIGDNIIIYHELIPNVECPIGNDDIPF